MTSPKYIKYGGVKFINNVTPEEINSFVRELPLGDRESLFTVIKKLDQQGLISLLEDEEMTTIDANMQPFME